MKQEKQALILLITAFKSSFMMSIPGSLICKLSVCANGLGMPPLHKEQNHYVIKDTVCSTGVLSDGQS